MGACDRGLGFKLGSHHDAPLAPTMPNRVKIEREKERGRRRSVINGIEIVRW
jgi:hypothetical protein